MKYLYQSFGLEVDLPQHTVHLGLVAVLQYPLDDPAAKGMHAQLRHLTLEGAHQGVQEGGVHVLHALLDDVVSIFIFDEAHDGTLQL